MTISAYLRAYLPADGLAVAGLEQADPLRDVVREGPYGLLTESLREDAFLAEWEGQDYVCPRFSRLRVLEGVLAFHNVYREIGGETIVPELVAKRAGRELARLRVEMPGAQSHILTSPWHVPMRWFVAFRSDEREVLQTEGGLSIRYRTGNAAAMARVTDALAVLDEVGMDPQISAELEELSGWLLGFDAEAMIELDYGGIASMFEEAELVMDESAAEVHSSLEALRHEDWVTAGSFYQTVATRWAPRVAVTISNRGEVWFR